MRVDENRKVSSRIGSPSKLEHVNRISTQKHSDAAQNGDAHSSSLISLPPGLNHITSLISDPRIRRPWKKLRTPKNRMIAPELNQLLREPEKSFCSSLCSHESQLNSLSWQYALLFPFCERAHSSPA